jgi:hypothetical protein
LFWLTKYYIGETPDVANIFLKEKKVIFNFKWAVIAYDFVQVLNGAGRRSKKHLKLANIKKLI